MSKIILVTGGARSGKSDFAESLCKKQNNSTAYIATSVAFDDEMKSRIKKHKQSRPDNWETYEIYRDIYTIIEDISKNHNTVILDCITLMVNNLMFMSDIDIEKASSEEIDKLEDYIKEQIYKLIEEVKKTDLYFVMVTNEIGLGVVPSYKLGRIYCDIAGRINQILGKLSDEVYFTLCGIPTKIKG